MYSSGLCARVSDVRKKEERGNAPSTRDPVRDEDAEMRDEEVRAEVGRDGLEQGREEEDARQAVHAVRRIHVRASATALLIAHSR